MTTTTEKYNGWKNYETWSVALWINNEQESQEWARNEAKHHLDKAQGDAVVSRSERARFDFCDFLKDHYEENSPLADDASVYSQLLNAALEEVDWLEVADSFLRDIDGYESLKD